MFVQCLYNVCTLCKDAAGPTFAVDVSKLMNVKPVFRVGPSNIVQVHFDVRISAGILEQKYKL